MCAKQLFLIRHAKSSWKYTGLKDHDRPLNNRGIRDAPFMAKKILEKKLFPDLILSSSAVRAKNTALIFIDSLNINSSKLIIEEKLYEATYNEILEVMKKVEENINTLFVFGHNPGLTSLHNFLCDSYIVNIPTCGITQYEFSGNWNALSRNSCKLLEFYYPKKYSDS
ncbi:MAG: histidine phosphatase family protein [Ignavibacteriaceae bacterium]